ncbi:hypothetical protein GZH46_02515 [Fragariocoptes setiger]|uniref:Uncharacterized protein n=1 Tax=Fragariocoptes setiger TaxID=1670756 RepID=A0ABQ7S6J7_9ACAR|nr:hypothetical protein GZH46_02515 [Fragariocoptes setiger]
MAYNLMARQHNQAKNAMSMTPEAIFKDYRRGMVEQSREIIRSSGSISRKLGTSKCGQKDQVSQLASNFAQLDSTLDNIENNLNKVCALTRRTD